MRGEYDGLGFTEAVRLCVARAHSLTKGDTNFLMRINHPDRSIRPEEKSRLDALVRRLRQGDLVDLAYRPPTKENAR